LPLIYQKAYIFHIVHGALNVQGIRQWDQELLVWLCVLCCFDGAFALLEFVEGESELAHALGECLNLAFESLPELLELLRSELLQIDFGCHLDIYG
jgi:hypothetical protein